MDRLIGKVKQFSASRNSGVLADIGGTSLHFTHKSAGGAPARFAVGQVVTYCVLGDAIKPTADDVRVEPR